METGESLLLPDHVRDEGAGVTAATLSADGQLRWGGRLLDLEREVLGFTVVGCRIEVRAVVDGADGDCCFGAKRSLVRKTFALEFLSVETLRHWNQKLQEYLDCLGRPKRLFVFVNPYGGKKSASQIFAKDVKPLLDDANIVYTVQETEYQLHAKEVVRSLDLTKYDGIVCVSGDGILVEVLNGLLTREDWNTAIKTPLGVVPAGSTLPLSVCYMPVNLIDVVSIPWDLKLQNVSWKFFPSPGTGNGMIKSLLDSSGELCTASNATLAIIRGHMRAMDVATVAQGDKNFFSMLMLAWGLVADIDIESEKFRWMGSARIDFYALHRILGLRKYNGSVYFVPTSGYESYGDPLDLEKDIAVDLGSEIKIGDAPLKNIEYGYQGPKVDSKGLIWRKIDGPFVSVWLHNVPWGSQDAKAAPNAEFSDGCLDLIVVKDCPKLSLLKLMSELNSGDHIKSPHVSYLKVKAFVLQPGSQITNPGKGGIIDVDGEVLARGNGTYKCEEKTLMSYDKLFINIDQGLATLFSPK